MTNINKLLDFSVKIEGGSGCLFQPSTRLYSYILTAKHVIKDNESPLIIRQLFDGEKNLVNQSLEIIDKPYLHTDDSKDAAIIKVKFIEGLNVLLRTDNPLEIKNIDWYLTGHPAVRNVDPFSFRHNRLNIYTQKTHGYIEGELDKVATHSEIVGQSGGGIIGLTRDEYFLAGIQKKMSASDETEALGRIDFMPLTFFDEIISANSQELAELKQSLADKPVEIFYSHSPGDMSLIKRISEHFAALRMQEVISEWHKGKIEGGRKTPQEQIDSHLNSAQIILLLISNNYLNSPECRAEMTRAMERFEAQEARVIPIILRLCDWKNTPVGRLASLPPQWEKPAMASTDKHQVFYEIATGIIDVVNNVKKEQKQV